MMETIVRILLLGMGVLWDFFASKGLAETERLKRELGPVL
jgi:hypothetical protein